MCDQCITSRAALVWVAVPGFISAFWASLQISICKWSIRRLQTLQPHVSIGSMLGVDYTQRPSLLCGYRCSVYSAWLLVQFDCGTTQV